jgi:hypothetical protein
MILFLFQSIHAQDSQTQGRGWKRFQVEIFGGLSFMNPTDLNLRPEYDKQYLIDQKEFYEYYYPSVQQGVSSDEFKKVKSALPYGFRFKYRLSQIFSLSLGLKYYSKNQTSNVSAFFYDLGDRPYVLYCEYSPYSIATSAFSPLLGVHFLLGKGELLGFEVFLSGGPLFADCKYLIGVKQLYARDNNVYRMNETSYEIQGSSTGLSLDTGARIDVGIKSGFEMFCEGGYSYQIVKNLHGKGKFIHYVYQGLNTKMASDELNWEGYWGVKETESFAPFPSNDWEKEDHRVREFKLDLSGAFLRIGISFSFSL